MTFCWLVSDHTESTQREDRTRHAYLIESITTDSVVIQEA